MTAARCLCSHTALSHNHREGQCWSTACGCQSFRPRDGHECRTCYGTGQHVVDEGWRFEVSLCEVCHGKGVGA